jgi:hypothetical protein
MQFQLNTNSILTQLIAARNGFIAARNSYTVLSQTLCHFSTPLLAARKGGGCGPQALQKFRPVKFLALSPLLRPAIRSQICIPLPISCPFQPRFKPDQSPYYLNNKIPFHNTNFEHMRHAIQIF